MSWSDIPRPDVFVAQHIRHKPMTRKSGLRSNIEQLLQRDIDTCTGLKFLVGAEQYSS